MAAQLQITSTFGQQAAKAAGDFANGKAKELRAEGKEEEARRWDEGGEARSAVHAVIGALTGGVGGALGAGAAALSADAINQAGAGLPAGLKEAVGGAIAAGMGAVAGGGFGAMAALNEDLNNRQLHFVSSRDVDVFAKKEAVKLGLSPQEVYVASMLVLEDYFDKSGEVRPEFLSVTAEQS